MGGFVELVILLVFKLVLWGVMGSQLAIGGWILLLTAIVIGLIFRGIGPDD